MAFHRNHMAFHRSLFIVPTWSSVMVSSVHELVGWLVGWLVGTHGFGTHLEEYISRREFRQDATQRPDVHLLIVWEPEDDLRGAVRAGLHVRAELVRHKARGAKVDDL
jgi:hypothetical protein